MSDYEREFYARLDALAEEALEAALESETPSSGHSGAFREALRRSLRRGYIAGFRHGFVTCARAADAPHLRSEYIARDTTKTPSPDPIG